MISLVLVILTKIYHWNIMHIHKWVGIEMATILIILLVSLVPSGALLKTQGMSNTSPLDGNICKVIKLRIFVVLFLCFALPMVFTTDIDHSQHGVVQCQRNRLDSCCNIKKNSAILNVYIILWYLIRVQKSSFKGFSGTARDFSEGLAWHFYSFLVYGWGYFLHFGSLDVCE